MKRVAVGFLATVLALGGCGGSDEASDAASAEPASATESPSPAASASPSATSTGSSVTTAPNPFAGEKGLIAYQTNRGGAEGIWTIKPDGTSDERLDVHVDGEQVLPDWHPDGEHLIFISRGGEKEPLMEYDFKVGTSRQLFDCEDPCHGEDDPAYSRDGKKVAFVRYIGPLINDEYPTDCSLWIGDLESRKAQQITHNAGTACDREYNPRWSPDGEQLVYWRQPTSDGKRSETAVYVIDADGKNERRLTDPQLAAGEADWSPDGEWVVFATHPLAEFDGGVMSDLQRVHPDGAGLEHVTHFESEDLRATQPRYTADGKWIVFTAVTPTSRSLWAIPAEGGDPVVIAQGGIYTHGTWQPKG